jgi:hypothetical protein
MDRPQCIDPIERMASQARARRLASDAAVSLRRRIQERLFEDVADITTDNDVREPGGFLAGIMAGHDPRAGAGVVARIIENVRSRGPGAMPTQSEWDTLADLIDHCPALRGEYVPLEASQKAAEKLLPYLYESQKSEKHAAPIQSIAIVTPLTPDEIAAFIAQWNADN